MKFSIITVVKNRRSTISSAIDSICAQNFDSYEHIVQDGGSTDGTFEFLNANGDMRMRLVSESDSGIYDALNRALARSTGDVIGLLHSDDFFAHPNVLLNVSRIFERTGAAAVYGDLDYVSATDTSRIVRHWRSGEYHPAKLKRGWMPPHPALFLRREVIEEWGGYDTSYKIASDYDLILRYFGKGKISAAYLPEVLVKMRVGGESNRSLERVILKSLEDYCALRNNKVGGIGALFLKNFCKIDQFILRGK